MANDYLVQYQQNLPVTREEALTRQFYEWEQRGRGWQLCSFPVELEPPFRPFYLFDISPGQIVDDGRRPTFFSQLFEELKGKPGNQSSNQADSETLAIRERMAELDEPVVCNYYEEEFSELRLILPKDLRVTKAVAEQFLLSLSYSSSPVSFEIIGTNRQIVIQMAATDRDYPQLKQQLKAHIPNSSITESNGFLSDAWETGGFEEVIVDFGLSHEFMMPLRAASSFDIDPLVPVIGALSNLEDEEIGVFQVLFQKARFSWAEEIMSSVRFFDGTPFFANAPEMIPLAKEKVSRPLFAAVIRVGARSHDGQRAWQIARHLGAGLTQTANPSGNELIPLSNDGYDRRYHEHALLNRQSFRCGMILNADELVSLVHPPSAAIQSEKLIRESERTKPVPALALNHQLVLGENHHQNQVKSVTLSNAQRTKHIHLIGSSGSGKSTLLLNLIKQDLETGEGLCVIDPHGDLVDEAMANVPESRLKDVILFDPSDSDYPIGFNILQAKSDHEKTLLSSDLIATFRRMSTSWGDVMDSVLANAILAFVESSRKGTLFDLKRFLVEKEYRLEFLKTVEDRAVRYFWLNEFPLISGKPQSSILIRLDAFLRQKLIRNIVCQKETKLDFRQIMDDRKVLLIKLSQGLIGEENAYLLGTLLVSKLYQTALSRQDTMRRPFFWLYLDEFHHFITPSMESVLSGVRKYNLGLILAHQEFRQLQSRSQEVASSVLSNCYTRICFRLGDTDAEKFAAGFSFFDAKSLQNLGVGEAIARIERSEYDFNLKMNLPPKVEKNLAQQRRFAVIRSSRENHGTLKAKVEDDLFALQTNPIITSIPVNKAPDVDVQKAPAQKIKTEKQPIESDPEANNGHRYLQSVIKRVGENNGFIATIEREVFGGVGKVDVALENERYKIACEIAVKNTAEYELQNIQKCLASGFERVAVISDNTKHLQNIMRRAEISLTSEQLIKVHFLEPENFHLFLEYLNRQTDNSITENTGKVKGYRVKAGFGGTSEKEAQTRRQTVFDVIKSALKRKGKTKDSKE